MRSEERDPAGSVDVLRTSLPDSATLCYQVNLSRADQSRVE